MVSVTLSQVTVFKNKPNYKPNAPDNLRNNSTNGILSRKSKRKLLGRFSRWFLTEQTYLKHGQLCYKSKPSKFTFLTLTLPTIQEHSDQEIKSKCLNNFLNKLRYYRKGLRYAWKAEVQKNGNIHFHLILNSYFDYRLTDKLWHDSLELLGYITAYEERYGSRYPPTNKIELVASKKKLMCYAAKYMAKIEDKAGVEGRIWYMCQALQTEAKSIGLIEDEHLQILLHNANSAGIKVIENDYVRCFYIERLEQVKAFPPNIRDCYRELLEYYHCRYYDFSLYESKYSSTFPDLDRWIIENEKPSISQIASFASN